MDPPCFALLVAAPLCHPYCVIVSTCFNNSCHVTLNACCYVTYGVWVGWGDAINIHVDHVTITHYIAEKKKDLQRQCCRRCEMRTSPLIGNSQEKWSYQSFFREHLQASLFRAGEMHKTRINSQPFQHLCCFNLPHVRSC